MDVVQRGNDLRSHHASLTEQLKEFFDNKESNVTEFMSLFETYRLIETTFCLKAGAYADLSASLIRDLIGANNNSCTVKIPDFLPTDINLLTFPNMFARKIKQARYDRSRLVDWFALWDTCPAKQEDNLLERFQDYVVSLHSDSVLVFGSNKMPETDFVNRLAEPYDYRVKSLPTKVLLGLEFSSALTDYCIHANRGLRIEAKRAARSEEFMETAVECFELLSRRLMVCFYLQQLTARGLHDCPVNIF